MLETPILPIECGGGSGIRTHVTVSRKHAFQACAFSHSATPPDWAFLNAASLFHEKLATPASTTPFLIGIQKARLFEGRAFSHVSLFLAFFGVGRLASDAQYIRGQSARNRDPATRPNSDCMF